MQCDLCGLRNFQVLRVNGWVVCDTCSKSEVLADALEVQARLDRLRATIREADIEADLAADLKVQAERRIDAAEKELAAAIHALIPLVADSTRADDAASKARELLAAFEINEPSTLTHHVS